MSKRLIALTATIITVATWVLAPATAHALNVNTDNPSPIILQLMADFDSELNPPLTVKPIEKPEPDPPEPKPEPKPVKYTVRSGDNLSNIARDHDVSWLRLWNANEKIEHPDLIYIDQVILIPPDSMKLDDRAVPEPVVRQVARSEPKSSTQRVTRGPTAGNRYSYGYCTWYVKNRRPDIPNLLGDAHEWYGNAAAQGFAVGSTPRAGAVGWTDRGSLGHVVYVERVNGDGTILISEMNYKGWNIKSSRTTSASEFRYIY